MLEKVYELLLKVDSLLTGKEEFLIELSNRNWREHHNTLDSILFDSGSDYYLSDGGYSRLVFCFEDSDGLPGVKLRLSGVSLKTAVNKWRTPEVQENIKEIEHILTKMCMAEYNYV